jgi:2-polyprenyl-3-methyl-5-hydroxy-6-metoxy-1,4-benzoquinol methylase
MKTKKKIWDKYHLLMERSYLRARGRLPEMESAIQLRSIINHLDANETVMDVGCAAGNYLRSIRKMNKYCKYYGIDQTSKYITFAKAYFKSDPNATFIRGNIYKLKKKADIVFCCNVLLHLPSIITPLTNLLKIFKKKLIVRTLISEETHLSKRFTFEDYNGGRILKDFAYENTYSFNYIEKIIKSFDKNIKLKFLKDNFSPKKLNVERNIWKNKFSSSFTTEVLNNKIQISGNKVFKWAWFTCTKH